MIDEKWVPAYLWAGLYEVSNFGRIRSVRRMVKSGTGRKLAGGSIVQPIFHKDTKYLVVNLSGDGKRKQVLVHRIVLESFIGACPTGKEACHSDGDRRNPVLSNLRWDTRKNNHADKKLHGTWQGGEKNGNAKLDRNLVLHIRQSGKTIKQLVREIGVSHGCIEKAKYRATWAHVQ